MAITVTRTIIYTYDNPEVMGQDMINWTMGGAFKKGVRFSTGSIFIDKEEENETDEKD